MGSRCGYWKYFNKENAISAIADKNDPLFALVKKWTEKAKSINASYCPLKHVGIDFVYHGVVYVLTPININSNDNDFEALSEMIENDLVALGCDDVFYSGMID